MAEIKVEEVITPNNLGKTLIRTGNIWDVKLHPSSGLTINENGEVAIAISKEKANGLQQKDDGLYYGTEAPKELKDLYVSNSGSDDNAGTRQAPLRTFRKALEKLKDMPVTYTIWLHEGQTFDHGGNNVELLSAKLNIRTYGSTVDSLYPDWIPENHYYRGYVARDFPRATLQFRVRVRANEKKTVRDHIIFREITVRGMNIEVDMHPIGTDNAGYSGSYMGIFNTSTTVGCTFHGSILNKLNNGIKMSEESPDSYRDDYLFRGNIFWVDSVFKGEAHYIARRMFTPSFVFTTWNARHLEGHGVKPDHISLVTGGPPDQNVINWMIEQVRDGVYVDIQNDIMFPKPSGG